MTDRIVPCAVGDRIRLDHMGPDPNPIPVGTTGTVERMAYVVITEDWQIGVRWDNGRTLSLIWPEDRFTIITRKEKAK